MWMLKFLLVPATALTFALVRDWFKSKIDDKIHYPKFLKRTYDNRITIHVYKFPVGMPSIKLFKRLKML